jgi:hypothetical protein
MMGRRASDTAVSRAASIRHRLSLQSLSALYGIPTNVVTLCAVSASDTRAGRGVAAARAGHHDETHQTSRHRHEPLGLPAGIPPSEAPPDELPLPEPESAPELEPGATQCSSMPATSLASPRPIQVTTTLANAASQSRRKIATAGVTLPKAPGSLKADDRFACTMPLPRVMSVCRDLGRQPHASLIDGLRRRRDDWRHTYRLPTVPHARRNRHRMSAVSALFRRKGAPVVTTR